MFDAARGRGGREAHAASKIRHEAFRRIEDGEEGLFLAGACACRFQGLYPHRARTGAAVSIREFREKMQLETELAEIEDQLRAKTKQLR